MYNRYVPREDGTFQKSRETEPGPREENREPTDCTSHAPAYTGETPDCCRISSMGIGSFLKNLLPKGLDTEDLLVILLLLLISGNDSRDGKQAMLTLGAYLFL